MIDVSFLPKGGIRRERAIMETCNGEVSSQEVGQTLWGQLRRQRDNERRQLRREMPLFRHSVFSRVPSVACELRGVAFLKLGAADTAEWQDLGLDACLDIHYLPMNAQLYIHIPTFTQE